MIDHTSASEFFDLRNTLSKRDQQTLFQAVLNKFLSKNEFFQGTTILGVGIFILLTVLVSIISYWIPLILGGLLIYKGLRKSIPGVKKDLTDLEKRTIILLESDD